MDRAGHSRLFQQQQEMPPLWQLLMKGLLGGRGPWIRELSLALQSSISIPPSPLDTLCLGLPGDPGCPQELGGKFQGVVSSL